MGTWVTTNLTITLGFTLTYYAGSMIEAFYSDILVGISSENLLNRRVSSECKYEKQIWQVLCARLSELE